MRIITKAAIIEGTKTFCLVQKFQPSSYASEAESDHKIFGRPAKRDNLIINNFCMKLFFVGSISIYIIDPETPGPEHRILTNTSQYDSVLSSDL